MSALWTRMEEIFPHKWSSKVGPVGSNAFKTWHRELEDLSLEQISSGLKACVHTGEDWPPSLPRFRALCIEHGSAAMYQAPDGLSLPKPRPSRDKARPYLQALRQALTGAL